LILMSLLRTKRHPYQYASATAEGAKGDVHAAIKILTIDLNSH
jgi:hypothetical protein